MKDSYKKFQQKIHFKVKGGEDEEYVTTIEPFKPLTLSENKRQVFQQVKNKKYNLKSKRHTCNINNNEMKNLKTCADHHADKTKNLTFKNGPKLNISNKTSDVEKTFLHEEHRRPTSENNDTTHLNSHNKLREIENKTVDMQKSSLKKDSHRIIFNFDIAKHAILQKERDGQIKKKKIDAEKKLAKREHRRKLESEDPNKYSNVFARMVLLDDEQIINIGHRNTNGKVFRHDNYMGRKDLQPSFVKNEQKKNTCKVQGHRRCSSFSREKQHEALKQISSDGMLLSLCWKGEHSQANKTKSIILQKERDAQLERKRKDLEKKLAKQELRKVQSKTSSERANVFARIVHFDDEELMKIGHIDSTNYVFNNKPYIAHKDLFRKQGMKKKNPYQHQGHRRYSSFSRRRHSDALKQISSDGRLIQSYLRKEL